MIITPSSKWSRTPMDGNKTGSPSHLEADAEKTTILSPASQVDNLEPIDVDRADDTRKNT